MKMNIIATPTEDQIISGLAINLRQIAPYLVKPSSNVFAELTNLKNLAKKYGATIALIVKERGLTIFGTDKASMIHPVDFDEQMHTIKYIRISDPVCQMLEDAGLNK